MVGIIPNAVNPRQRTSPAGYVYPLATPVPASSQFRVSDAEGAPSRAGGRFHAAVDWFATAGASVFSPVQGMIVEARPAAGDYSGQVFGGTVKVREAQTGRIWVFRHVDPKARVGQQVTPGTRVASVAPWRDNPKGSHAHIELWRTLAGGYTFENMIDPITELRSKPGSKPGGGGGVGGALGSVGDAARGVGGFIKDGVADELDPRSASKWFKWGDTDVLDALLPGSPASDAAKRLQGGALRLGMVLGGFALVVIGLLLIARQAGAPVPGPAAVATRRFGG